MNTLAGWGGGATVVVGAGATVVVVVGAGTVVDVVVGAVDVVVGATVVVGAGRTASAATFPPPAAAAPGNTAAATATIGTAKLARSPAHPVLFAAFTHWLSVPEKVSLGEAGDSGRQDEQDGLEDEDAEENESHLSANRIVYVSSVARGRQMYPGGGVKRALAVLCIGALSASACGGGGGTNVARKAVDLAQPRVEVTTAEALPRPAWVNVPVATVWDRPDLVRPVDAEAVEAKPALNQWLASLTFAERLDLGKRMATQALLDDPLTVYIVRDGWADVLVDEQTGSGFPQGIAGWVPLSQISFQAPEASSLAATVVAPFADSVGSVLSYGTRLPVLGSTADSVAVSTPGGQLSLPKGDIVVGSLPPSGAAVLQEAERFLGLPYLWGGTSAYGYDCSGLTYSVYRQFGIDLARDAADQALQGVAVPKSQLRPGDLVFFAAGGTVHHVAFYAGRGLMLDAPETGGRVELVPLWGTPLATQYAGARRYIAG